MRNIIIAVIALCLGGLVGFLAVVRNTGPSTADLDASLADINKEIDLARVEQNRFGNGLIAVQTGLRVATLESTRAMIEEKRASFLRGITLVHADGSNPKPVDSAALSNIDDRIGAAEREAIAADVEAARYSGGLLQSIDLLSAATKHSTVALLEQQRAVLMLGLGTPAVEGQSDRNANAPKPALVGKPTSDQDALK